MTKIPIARPYFDVHEESAVLEVLKSGWISQGPKSVDFENALASFVGVKHGRAVNSGTSAIQLALLACEIRPGDEVIVPAFTCVATLNPLEAIGAQPIPVDIDLQTFGLDASQLAQAITSKTKGIIVVHPFGLAANIGGIFKIASSSGLKVIEDAALGLGARIGDRQAGSVGDVACLSFHPRKMITTGEGGMVLTNSGKIATLVAELRNYGASVAAWSRHSGNLFDLATYEQAGYNYKLTDIQAAIGLEQVKKLPTIIEMHREVAHRYNEALADLPWLRLPQEPEGWTHVYQSYVCLLKSQEHDNLDALELMRQELWAHLAGFGVASVQGAQSMATIAYYRRKYGWRPQDFPMALLADRGSVALPVYPDMTEGEIGRVIDAVRSFQYQPRR